MINSPLTVIFMMVVNLAMLIIFIRFMFQFAQIDPKHPYSKATYGISAVVTVFQRIFPDLVGGRISLSAIILLLLLTYIKIAGLAGIHGEHLTPLVLFFRGTLQAILMLVTALKYTVFAGVILSWVILLSNKIHPAMEIIMEMAEPIIAPFRRFTPNLGMIDLSTLVALLALGLIETIIEVVGANILQQLM